MKDIQQIIEDQKKLASQRTTKELEDSDDKEKKAWMLQIASGILKFFRNETLKTEVTNQKDYTVGIKRLEDAVRAIPKTDKVQVTNLKDFPKEVKVSNLRDIKIPEVKIPEVKIPDNKKELLSIEKAVKEIKIPEVKVEKTVVDFSSVLEALQGVKKAIGQSYTKEDTKTQESALKQLTELNKGIDGVAKLINDLINKPEPEKEDNSYIIQGLQDVVNTIQNIKFPIPHVPTQNIVEAINNLKINVDNIDIDLDQVETKLDAIIAHENSVTATNAHTGSDELRVFEENHVCDENTTSTPLGANATFLGEWQDCLNYQEVNVSVDTDKDSALNGLVLQWSADGITIADTDVFSVYANSGTNYTPNPAFRYVRISYTNGAIAQTRFNLMTILRRGVTGGSFHRIDSTLRDDSDARLQLSVLKLRTAQNNYVSGAATNAGNFKTSIEEIEDGVVFDTIEASPDVTYTWTDGLLSQKVEVYADRTVTTDYTWENGFPTNKNVTIT